MSQFRRIKLAFEEGEGGKTPRVTPQGTSPMRPKFANAGSSTTPRPSPNAAKGERRPIQPVSKTRYSPHPKPAPKPASAKSSKAGPGEGEILVAVMGVTGSGKSHFCRAATSDDSIGVGDGLDSCITSYRYPPVSYIY